MEISELRFLVAEDHVDSRQTLSRVLRRMGYRVLEASNGHEGTQAIYDVVAATL